MGSGLFNFAVDPLQQFRPAGFYKPAYPRPCRLPFQFRHQPRIALAASQHRAAMECEHRAGAGRRSEIRYRRRKRLNAFTADVASAYNTARCLNAYREYSRPAIAQRSRDGYTLDNLVGKTDRCLPDPPLGNVVLDIGN